MTLSRLTTVLLCAVVWAGPASADAGLEPTTEERAALEAVLDERVEQLSKEASGDERPYRRAGYSRHFRSTDDGGWRTSLLADAAGDGRMRVERFAVTLAPSAGGGWAIVEETLEQSDDTLVRPYPGDEAAHRFSSIRLSREGLTVSAKNGTLYTDRIDDRVYSFRFSADEMDYVYEPPADAGLDMHGRYQHLLDDDKQRLIFKPDLISVFCDPDTCQQLLDEAVEGLGDASLDDLGPPLQRVLNRSRNNWNEALHDNEFVGFLKPDYDHAQYFIQVQHGDDEAVFLAYDSEAVKEVRFGAGGFGPLYGYPSAASRAAGTDPYELDTRPDDNAKDFELLGLEGKVEVALLDPDLVEADLFFTIRTLRDLDSLEFAFSDISGAFGRRRATEKNPAIRVHAFETSAGEELTFTRLSPSRGIILLDEVVPAGTEVTLRMWFSNRGCIVQVNHAYFAMNREGWLPFVRFTDKIDRFDLTVRTPSKFTVLGIGETVTQETTGDVTSTRWVARSPVTFPTIILGNYYEDTPKTTATRFDGSEIPVNIHVDKASMSAWDIRQKQLRPPAEQAVNALNVYRELYGMDYPYHKLDLVNDQGFLGGQAPASIVYLGAGSFRSEATTSETFDNASYAARFASSLVAHEVGHQWWGALIGNKNQQGYWFVESLAEYSSALFLEILESEGYQKPEKGLKAYRVHVDGWRREILDDDPSCSVEDASSFWCAGGNRAALYAKGPYAFHMLRQTFGDEKFFAFLKDMAQDLGGKLIVTRDIQHVAESSFGGVDAQGNPYNVDLEWFFDQWIRSVGMPEFGFFPTYRMTEDGKYLVSGKVLQRVLGTKDREFEGVYFRGVVPVTVEGKDGQEYSAKLVVQGPETPFQFKVPVEPREITLNPYGEILAHDVLDAETW